MPQAINALLSALIAAYATTKRAFVPVSKDTQDMLARQLTILPHSVCQSHATASIRK